MTEVKKASTDIDVFWLYERNKKVYDFCTWANRKCPSIEGECYCHLIVAVLPLTIGDQFTHCNMRVKCYINPQEDCSICLEKICKKSDAYLTNCGHSFHKSCLFKTYENGRFHHKKSNNNIYYQLNCPLCRKQIFYPDFYCRYPQWSVVKKEKNYLDVLEEFWLSKDYTMIQLCYKSNNNHYLGMKNNCHHCINYRNDGMI